MSDDQSGEVALQKRIDRITTAFDGELRTQRHRQVR